MAKGSPRLPDEHVNLPQTAPLRTAVELLAGAALLAIIAYASIAYFVDFAVWALPADADRQLRLPGLERFGAMRADNHPRQRALQTMVDGLARGWPERPYDFELAIVEQSQPNAFAVPGGGIVVTTGLLDGADDTDGAPGADDMELAFVLGHELGHFEGRDHLRGLGRDVLLSLLLGAAGSGGADTGLVGGAAQLGALRFSRAQETAADRFGLILVHRLYGHVRGTFAFFERTIGSDGIGDRLPSFTSTHPRSQARMDALHDFARSRGWETATAALP